MNRSETFAIYAAVVFALMGLSPSANAEGKSPVVVELFTSQGCSSCPPANANLIKLSQRPGVLTLSFAVTYWDYLGWKDSFGKSEFTDRQLVYEPALGERGPYTPQMVVNGRTTAVGNSLSEVEGLIESATSDNGPTILFDQGSVDIGAGTGSEPSADVWLVHYDANVVEVPVGRGENAGRTLPHTHVVHALDRLGEWKGTALSFKIPPAPDGLRTAVLVQATNGGPILAASTD